MTVSAERLDAEHLLALRGELETAPVERAPISALRVGDSPRSTTEDPEHARALADAGEALPPVLVHRASMTVVDGIHRLRAAQLRGRTTVAVRWFDGSAEDARLLAVALNVTHGLPLTAGERSAAAEHILTARPEWSDRAVAKLAGLSPSRTASIRRRLAGAAEPGDKRVGRDGRARPLDPGPGRERAAALLRENPQASLRQIARQAGVSPGTVAGVRARMARGDAWGRPADGSGAGEEARDAERLHSMLRRDPALRFTETGRSLLRLMEAGAALARHREDIAAGLPPHCKDSVARLAQEYAKSWQLLADELL
ncbi:hypothetical protein ACVHNB_38650 [Streptomyces sp. YJ-C3]